MSPFLIKVLLAAGAGTALAYAAGSKEKKAQAAQLPPPGQPPAGPAPTPAEIKPAIDTAMMTKTAEDFSAAAYQAGQAGMQQTADVLRDMAAQASQSKGPPPVEDQPHNTIEPTMPADLSAEVGRVLRDSQDPAVLDALATKLRSMGYGQIADQLQAKAKQIRDTLSTAATMQQIDDVLKSPGVAQVTPGTQTIPTTIVAKTPQEIAAANVTRAVFAKLPDTKTTTGIKAAKKANGSSPIGYAEVMSFQSKEGLKQDGKLGPGTMLKVAKYESNLPPVLYWPTSATAKNVSVYRSDLETLALDAEQMGRAQRAAELRASAAREHGQGGIVGSLLP